MPGKGVGCFSVGFGEATEEPAREGVGSGCEEVDGDGPPVAGGEGVDFRTEGVAASWTKVGRRTGAGGVIDAFGYQDGAGDV